MAEAKTYAVEVDGITAEICPDAMDDADLIERMGEMGDNPYAAVLLGKALLGEEGYASLKDRLRDEDGKAPISAVADYLMKASSQVADLKNS